MEKKFDQENNAKNKAKDELKEKLQEGIKKILDSENFKNYLNTSGKYARKYSVQNSILVYLQKPEASYVMGYEAWKEYGRNVSQGANGIKIFMPVMAREKTKGSLWWEIKRSLKEQLKADGTKNASYRIGFGEKYCEFTMNASNKLIGFKLNGRESGIFHTEDEARRFIERCIIGRIPENYRIGNVFDIKDTIIPEYLWVKKYDDKEIAPDEDGNPIMNKRGEVRIFNSPERQSRFKTLTTELDMSIAEKDERAMKTLFESCVAVSNKRGVPVLLRSAEDDEELKGDTKGYYCRSFTDETPNGYIVIKNTLKETEKCSVLMHEMGHADLHSDLKKLQSEMGENVTSQMREIQAEAVAYSTASRFGIDTETSSFAYLAVYSNGFELQDLQKSIEVIYESSLKLTKDIEAELDLRGYTPELTAKDAENEKLNSENLKHLCDKYLSKTESALRETETDKRTFLNEMRERQEKSGLTDEEKEIAKKIAFNIEHREKTIKEIQDGIESLVEAPTRSEQQKADEEISQAVIRMDNFKKEYNDLRKEFSENEKVKIDEEKQRRFERFQRRPISVLRELGEKYPEIANLSPLQKSYLIKSPYLKNVIANELKTDTATFVKNAVRQASAIPDVSSKNGTFVEILECDKVTDKAIFANGTLCIPKLAEKRISEAEAQIAVFKKKSMENEYLPSARCQVTVFAQVKDELKALKTHVDIGNGQSNGLRDHLTKICKFDVEKEAILNCYTEALNDKRYTKKVYEPSQTDEASSQGESRKEAKAKKDKEWG